MFREQCRIFMAPAALPILEETSGSMEPLEKTIELRKVNEDTNLATSSSVFTDKIVEEWEITMTLVFVQLIDIPTLYYLLKTYMLIIKCQHVSSLHCL